MRTLAAVSRWLSAGILSLVLLAAASPQAHADTGTYRIPSYSVTLQPQASGAVQITYEQTWEVLSGNIPWITVGLPNSSFSVVERGGAARSVAAQNSGGFVGVRVDLDRTYLPGERFNIRFVVLQNNLLERLTSEKKWRISFTPGWYDNAPLGSLKIVLVSPVSLDSYSLVTPVPSTSSGGSVTWEKTNLSPGSRFNVRVECLDGSFLTATAPAKNSRFPWSGLILVVVLAGLIALIVLAVRKAKEARDSALKARIAATERELAEDESKRAEAEKGFREYVIEKGMEPDEQGRYYDRSYGNYITPAIWAAVLMSGQRNSTTPSDRVSSCACACVACACACACACAGGGAAGCSRKTLHECRDCEGAVKEPTRP